MRHGILILLCALALGCGRDKTPKTAGNPRYETAMAELNAAKSPQTRFYALNSAAKENFNAGNIDIAGKLAQELADTLPKFAGDWNYGNAVQDANLVLGRIAVRDGRIGDAREFLLKAGRSSGSPQMDTFGPNMSLAKDLLEKGERQAVLEYFESCRAFWKMHDGKLDDWSRQVKDGKTPDFGANLVY